MIEYDDIVTEDEATLGLARGLLLAFAFEAVIGLLIAGVIRVVWWWLP